jgi:hypothetical protein
MLAPDRHNRGWPRVALITEIVVTDQSWRFCIEATGWRDTTFHRSGYLEIVQFRSAARGSAADIERKNARDQ